MADNDKRALAIIPARGGSVRLPRKNMLPVNGKPLIGYSIEAALDSRVFDTVMFSSDDDEILEIAGGYEGVTLHKRSADLAKSTTKVLELVCTIADDPEVQKNFDIIALLLPTCPFRRVSDLRNGVELLTRDYDSCVSVTTYEFPPQLALWKNDESDELSGVFDPCPLETGDTRSQDQKTIYRPNGGFYMAWLDRFVNNRNYFIGRTRGYEMPRLASVDIDERLDLEYAEFLLKSGRVTLD